MIITVHVKPGSKKGNLLEQAGEKEYIAFLRARAKDGEANTALINLLSSELKVPKSLIRIKSGLSSRIKHVEILL